MPLSACARLGPYEILAFLIGPDFGNAIGIASIDSGRILHRIPFDKGTVSSLAATPDGATLYCAAGGAIWSVPVSGGEVRKIGQGFGVALDTERQSLIVQSTSSNSIRLSRLPLSGGPAREIFTKGLVTTNAIPINGRVGPNDALVAPGILPDSWFQPPIIVDLNSGSVNRIQNDLPADYFSLAWTPDGQIAALAYGLRASLWKFHQ